jgi:hypothetical protein
VNGEFWADYELQELYEVVNDIDWFERVRTRLPRRSEAAIRRRMCQLREEARIVPHNTRCRSKSSSFMLRRQAEQGSAKLKTAMLVGMR